MVKRILFALQLLVEYPIYLFSRNIDVTVVPTKICHTVSQTYFPQSTFVTNLFIFVK